MKRLSALRSRPSGTGLLVRSGAASGLRQVVASARPEAGSEGSAARPAATGRGARPGRADGSSGLGAGDPVGRRADRSAFGGRRRAGATRAIVLPGDRPPPGGLRPPHPQMRAPGSAIWGCLRQLLKIFEKRPQGTPNDRLLAQPPQTRSPPQPHPPHPPPPSLQRTPPRPPQAHAANKWFPGGLRRS